MYFERIHHLLAEYSYDCEIRHIYAATIFNLMGYFKQERELAMRDDMLDKLRRLSRVYSDDTNIVALTGKGLFNVMLQADTEGNHDRRDDILSEIRKLYARYPEHGMVRLNLAMWLGSAIFWCTRDRDLRLRHTLADQLRILASRHQDDKEIVQVWDDTLQRL